jgi:hypothetical protein
MNWVGAGIGKVQKTICTSVTLEIKEDYHEKKYSDHVNNLFIFN